MYSKCLNCATKEERILEKNLPKSNKGLSKCHNIGGYYYRHIKKVSQEGLRLLNLPILKRNCVYAIKTPRRMYLSWRSEKAAARNSSMLGCNSIYQLRLFFPHENSYNLVSLYPFSSTLVTFEISGPCLKHSTKSFKLSQSPCASTSTVPSLLFLTHPTRSSS